MSEIQTWDMLPKSMLDNEKISESIAGAVADHNADPEAHLGENESLQSHRASEIIDHLAESVVNDKLQHFARAYVAIVGSGVEGDFDSIQSAVDYAISVGGGNIFITPGEYYLSGVVDLPMNINLVGADIEAVIVHAGKTGGNYFNSVADDDTQQIEQLITNINFVNDGGGVFYAEDDLVSRADEWIRFNNCRFEGGGAYVSVYYVRIELRNCYVESDATGSFNVGYELRGYYTEFRGKTGATTNLLVDSAGDKDLFGIILENCTMWATTNNAGVWISSTNCQEAMIRFSTFYGWIDGAVPIPYYNFSFNRVQINGSNTFVVNSPVTGIIIMGNVFDGGSANNFAIETDNALVLGNKMQGIPQDSGSGNLFDYNLPMKNFGAFSGSTTAMALALNITSQLTPNSTRTLTTTVPPAGQRRTLIILTSGTTSYTMTFGTGFKTTGTLATGATSARRFVIEFISDGNFLIESSRTVAIA